MIATAKGATMGEGDKDDKWRIGRIVDLLAYEERAGSTTTGHQRVGSKIGTPHLRANIRQRADVGAEIVCIMLAVDQMQRGEFECWLALKEGVLFDRAPRKRMRTYSRRTWHSVPPPARSATVEEVARHYGYTERSVREMDRRARKTLAGIREAAGLTGPEPRVPIWPAVMSQRNMMRHLFG